MLCTGTIKFSGKYVLGSVKNGSTNDYLARCGSRWCLSVCQVRKCSLLRLQKWALGSGSPDESFRLLSITYLLIVLIFWKERWTAGHSSQVFHASHASIVKVVIFQLKYDLAMKDFFFKFFTFQQQAYLYSFKNRNFMSWMPIKKLRKEQK